MTVGEVFNPWRHTCGFYPPDVVGRLRNLVDRNGNRRTVTDGQKRLYERIVRWSGKQGTFWRGFKTMAAELGKCERQIKADMTALEDFGLVAHRRRQRQTNLYQFLWHPIFEVQSTAYQEPDSEVQDAAHQEGVLEVQDPLLEVQDHAKKGGLDVQSTARKSCPKENYVREESSSERPQSKTETEINDDDPSFSHFENQNPEAFGRLVAEFQRMLRLSRAETLGVEVERVEAPDRAITIRILRIFVDGADALKWLEGTGRRGLARKATSATWGLWLEDARNQETQIRLDREAREVADREAELKDQTAAAVAAEKERIMNSPMPAAQAIEMAGPIPGNPGRRVPWALRARWERCGEYLSPRAAVEAARAWKTCATCGDRGVLGCAVDRNLEFCGCLSGDEAKHRDGADWPEREIERVHATPKSLLAAAYGDFGSDAVLTTEVCDDGQTVTIKFTDRLQQIWLTPRELKKPFWRIGWQERALRVIGPDGVVV